MDINPTTFTIADYCASMKRGDIRVNRQYQRSDKVWPAAAQSFLIESILLGYPVPKLSLFQITDIKSRTTVKEIVDGQQRSSTIKNFYDEKFAIARNCAFDDISGCKFSDLDDVYQHQFLDYALSVDLFVSATAEEIREVFRRINSYTVPLNPEEQRHAQYQGEFKWFVYHLSNELDQNFLDLGVFGQKAIIRMSDAKWICEVTHALLYGISTTNRKSLDALYRDHNEEGSFSLSDEVSEKIHGAVNKVIEIPHIHNTPLMKPYNFYSLVLAFIHCEYVIDELLNVVEQEESTRKFSDEEVAENLSELAEVLNEPEAADSYYQPFIDACTSRTNVKVQRETRFRWFCGALAFD